MIIQVLNVEVSKASKGGRAWETAEVSYKDENGKVNAKKLMSFNNADVFSSFKSASPGHRFDVQSVKNDKGFWDWVGVREVSGAAEAPQPATGGAVVSGKANTYNDPRETKEEREKKQQTITRQACLNTSVASFGTAASEQDVEAFITRARVFENYVNGQTIVDLEDDPI